MSARVDQAVAWAVGEGSVAIRLIHDYLSDDRPMLLAMRIGRLAWQRSTG
jgi:hypothetical protein